MMKPPPNTPVLIAGGGPVGLAAAVELGTRGVECVVLEPRESVNFLRPRAKTTSIRTMEHFRRWGLAERVREAAPLPVSWAQDAVFCTNLLGQEITRFSDCFGLTPTRTDAYAESGQQIPQSIVEQVLRQAVDVLPSVTFASGWSLDTLTETADGVLVDAVAGDGTTQRITARYVLGCDGVASRTRECLGARLLGPQDGMRNLSIVFRAPALAQRVPHGPAVHYWVFNPGITGVLGRFDLEDTWWAGVSGRGDDADPAALVDELVGAPTECEILSTDVWNARMQLADRFQTDRVFLVGDAAHLNPPWGGHGYNTGIGDAVNIGWKLAATLQGWGGPELPLSYQPERRGVAEQTIAETTANMRAVQQIRPASTPDGASMDPQAIAQLIRRGMEAEFHSLGLVLGYHYENSPVIVRDDEAADHAGHQQADDPTVYSPSTRPGARLPHSWLDDGRSLYDVVGPGLTLMDLGGDTVTVESIVESARRRGVPMAVVDMRDSELAADSKASLLIVRPDQHVAYRASRTSPAEPADIVLDQILGGRRSAGFTAPND